MSRLGAAGRAVIRDELSRLIRFSISVFERIELIQSEKRLFCLGGRLFFINYMIYINIIF